MIVCFFKYLKSMIYRSLINHWSRPCLPSLVPWAPVSGHSRGCAERGQEEEHEEEQTLGVHPLSWLLSNKRLENVPFVNVPHTSSNRLLLSNQDKGCTPSVAHSLALPLGHALHNVWIKKCACASASMYHNNKTRKFGLRSDVNYCFNLTVFNNIGPNSDTILA